VRSGVLVGCERLGGTLYEIDPGNRGSPYHLHHGDEELIIVMVCPEVCGCPRKVLVQSVTPGVVSGSRRISAR
jgi:hypothetical protein